MQTDGLGLAGTLTAAQAGMGVMNELDAIAVAVINGGLLAGRQIFGALTAVLIMTGVSFLQVDTFYQEIVKGIIFVTSVVTDVCRQKRGQKIQKLHLDAVRPVGRDHPARQVRGFCFSGRDRIARYLNFNALLLIG